MQRRWWLPLVLLTLSTTGCEDSESSQSNDELHSSPFWIGGECFDEDVPPLPSMAASPCLHDGDCTEAEYCDKTPTCRGQGWCRTPQAACPFVVVEVCTCNGGNRNSPCGLSVGITTCARCDPCEDSSDCGEGQFCNAPGHCSGPGTCGMRPDHCPEDVAPVCGCDGTTYDSECLAWAAGVRVAARGPCECATSADCPLGEYCTAIRCDSPGTCVPIADVCAKTPPDTGATVCGCDGNNYKNECLAAQAGVRRAGFAECGTF